MFIEVKLASFSNTGATSKPVMINLHYVIEIRPPKPDEIGTCTLVINDSEEVWSMTTWETYEDIKAILQLEKKVI